jgi:hypothetical protein
LSAPGRPSEMLGFTRDQCRKERPSRNFLDACRAAQPALNPQ